MRVWLGVAPRVVHVCEVLCAESGGPGLTVCACGIAFVGAMCVGVAVFGFCAVQWPGFNGICLCVSAAPGLEVLAAVVVDRV